MDGVFADGLSIEPRDLALRSPRSRIPTTFLVYNGEDYILYDTSVWMKLDIETVTSYSCRPERARYPSTWSATTTQAADDEARSRTRTTFDRDRPRYRAPMRVAAGS